MRQLLAGYAHQGAGASDGGKPYDTIELTGTRRAPGRETSVYVYEMWWADLSRLGSGLARFAGAVYQLILHISHLGRKGLDIGADVASRGPLAPTIGVAWDHLASAHRRTVRLFTLWVPVLTLLTLCCIPFFVPAAVPASRRLLAGLLMTGLLLIVGSGIVLFKRDRRPNAATDVVALTVAIATIAIVALWRLDATRTVALSGTVLLTGGVAVLTFGAYVVTLVKYNGTRPGALRNGSIGAVLVIALTAASLRLITTTDPAEAVRQAAFIAFQWAYIGVMAVWLLIWLNAIWAYVRWAQLRWRIDARRRQSASAEGAALALAGERAHRAAFTARVTIAVSILGFILTALTAYQSTIYLAWRARDRVNLFPLQVDDILPPTVLGGRFVAPDARCSVAIPVVIPDVGKDSVSTITREAACAHQLFDAFVAQGGTSGLVVALIGVGVALLLVSWFVVLVTYTALAPPPPTSPVAQQLGTWMSDGFRWVRYSGNWLALTAVAALLLGAVLDFYVAITGRPLGFLGHFISLGSTHALLNRLAVAVLASAATIAAAQARVSDLTTHVRPVLGVLLDVDNHLRESPAEGTPRAKMAERYTALLKYVLERRDATNHDAAFCDHIVIVSHSQGTVITADLLRYLSATGSLPSLLTPSRVCLITMGCPLRQLYAAHFPDLYDWVEALEGQVPGRLGDGIRSIDGLAPDPARLCVGRWVNLYTSGDYVGRSLWRDETNAIVWSRSSVTSRSGDRYDRCLGAGTHTQYWTSRDVAAEIDSAI